MVDWKEKAGLLLEDMTLPPGRLVALLKQSAYNVAESTHPLAPSLSRLANDTGGGRPMMVDWKRLCDLLTREKDPNA